MSAATWADLSAELGAVNMGVPSWLPEIKLSHGTQGSQIANCLNQTLLSFGVTDNFDESPFGEASNASHRKGRQYYYARRGGGATGAGPVVAASDLITDRAGGGGKYYFGSMPAASSSGGYGGGCGCCCGKSGGGYGDYDLLLGLLALGAAAVLLGVFNNNGRRKRDLANELEFIDENEIVLRMLDDLMMTYKYGYIPKCSHYHICKLNKAAAFGGAPQSTVIPLVSLPAAWILGKPTSRVMDYLHAVWLGRNERDCDEAFPECSDINVSQSDAFKGSTGAPPPSSTLFGFFNSTTAKPKVKMEDMNDVETDVDKILEDLRYLEENASSSSPTPTPTEGPETQSA